MSLPRIESPKNPRIVAAAKLLDRKARGRAELYLVEGWRLVRAALEAGIGIEEMYVTREALERPGAGTMAASLLTQNVPVFEATGAVIARLSDTEAPQGIVAVARRVDARLEDLRLRRPPLLLAADAVSDPGNFGSLARIAGAAAADALVSLPGCCDWTSPKVLRASMGGVFLTPMVAAPPEALIAFARAHRLSRAALVAHGGESIYDANLTEGLALILGNEAAGIRPDLLEHCDRRLTIPMPGPAESLNVTAAAAIVVFEALRQRRAASRQP